MLRSSLAWLLAGFGFGGAMLTDRALPGQRQLWMASNQGLMLKT